MSDEVKLIPIDALIEDTANPRRHTDRNCKMIEGSLARFGAARSIVVDGKGVVRAGNATLAAAKAAGITTVRIIETDGNTLLAARRSDWSETEAVTYSITDNQTGSDLQWNTDMLQDILPTLPDDLVQATGFTDLEIKQFTTGMAYEAAAQNGDVIEDPRGEWQGMPAYEHEDQTSFRRIIVHLADQDAVEEFERRINQHISPVTK